MTNGFFVTGTDTEVGKTFVSCLLLHALSKQGKTVVGMKPIAAGQENGLWQDVELLRAAGNVDVPVELINPYALNMPIAPHIAAERQGVEIDLNLIHEKFQTLKHHAECVIVEGVGGFLVPVNNHQDTLDMARLLNLPVILVVGMRLGCINHALLTVRAIEAAGLTLAGWVANCIDPEMSVLEDNINALRCRINNPLIATVPFSTVSDTSSLSQLIDLLEL